MDKNDMKANGFPEIRPDCLGKLCKKLDSVEEPTYRRARSKSASTGELPETSGSNNSGSSDQESTRGRRSASQVDQAFSRDLDQLHDQYYTQCAQERNTCNGESGDSSSRGEDHIDYLSADDSSIGQGSGGGCTLKMRQGTSTSSNQKDDACNSEFETAFEGAKVISHPVRSKGCSQRSSHPKRMQRLHAEGLDGKCASQSSRRKPDSTSGTSSSGSQLDPKLRVGIETKRSTGLAPVSTTDGRLAPSSNSAVESYLQYTSRMESNSDDVPESDSSSRSGSRGANSLIIRGGSSISSNEVDTTFAREFGTVFESAMATPPAVEPREHAQTSTEDKNLQRQEITAGIGGPFAVGFKSSKKCHMSGTSSTSDQQKSKLVHMRIKRGAEVQDNNGDDIGDTFGTVTTIKTSEKEAHSSNSMIEAYLQSTLQAGKKPKRRRTNYAKLSGQELIEAKEKAKDRTAQLKSTRERNRRRMIQDLLKSIADALGVQGKNLDQVKILQCALRFIEDVKSREEKKR